jgi:hypothetical protein
MEQLNRMVGIGIQDNGANFHKIDGTNTDENDKPSPNVRGSANMGSHQRSTISMRLFAFACVGGFLAKGNCICCTLTGDGLAE